jgi:hypothetical protein
MSHERIAKKIVDAIADVRLDGYGIDMIGWYMVNHSPRPALNHVIQLAGSINSHYNVMREEIYGQQTLF